MVFHYCPNCGSPLGASREFAPQTCEHCGQTHYHPSTPCSGGLVMQGDSVLLVKRADAPFMGLWDIPGGFLEPGELPVDGMIRELREETGLDVRVREFLGVYMDRYDTPDGRRLYTMNSYFIVEPLGGGIVPADDVSDAQWFRVDALPPRSELAFEHSNSVLRDLTVRLKK